MENENRFYHNRLIKVGNYHNEFQNEIDERQLNNVVGIAGSASPHQMPS